jgi:vitamin B12 transporter
MNRDAWPARCPREALVSLLLAFCLTFVTPGIAQPAPPPADVATVLPIVVTASRTDQSLLDLLADVTWIGPEEIARSGVDSLAQLLQRQPGTEIVTTGGPGSTSGVFLRGANTDQTLVLVDGMRVASSTTGTAALEAIPLSQIDHIEILRGPASSLYGADAIGGVIQVFTRRGAAGFSANGSAGYGTYNTTDVTAGVGGSTETLRLSAQLDARRSDGFNAIANPQNPLYEPLDDGYREASLSVSGNWTYGPGQQLVAQFLRSRLNAQFDNGDSYDNRTITTLESWQVTSNNRVAPFWVSRLTAGNGGDDSLSETAFGNEPFVTNQHQYAWQNDFTLPQGLLTAAIERLEERVSTNPAFPVNERNTNSALAIYQLHADDQALQANLRVDDSDQYGSHTTGALEYGYRLASEWRVTASYGTAFKAPTFNDLYYPGFSNPNLVPETSRNIEGGVYGNGTAGDAKWDLRAVGWYNRVTDLIVFECNADFTICAPQNVQDATLKGIEFGATLTWHATLIRGSLDLQSPRDDMTGLQLPRRALRHGALAINQQVGPVSLGAELVASSLRYDDAANTVKMGGYAIVNLTAEWPLGDGLTLFARGDNIFNKNYQLAADYSTGGQQLFVGLRWQLQ